MWAIHTEEYYSALNRKEILNYVTAWINLEDTMLSEIGRPQKDTGGVTPLPRGP